MKNRFALTLMATLICSTLAMAQLQKLPAPAKTGGKPVMEALWSRASGTEFSDKMLSDQDLSNLLFAAIGVNRPADGDCPQLPGNPRVRVHEQGRLGIPEQGKRAEAGGEG